MKTKEFGLKNGLKRIGFKKLEEPFKLSITVVQSLEDKKHKKLYHFILDPTIDRAKKPET